MVDVEPFEKTIGRALSQVRTTILDVMNSGKPWTEALTYDQSNDTWVCLQDAIDRFVQQYPDMAKYWGLK